VGFRALSRGRPPLEFAETPGAALACMGGLRTQSSSTNVSLEGVGEQCCEGVS
jgi:hypothetical protein